jgi:hypothetical protein
MEDEKKEMVSASKPKTNGYKHIAVKPDTFELFLKLKNGVKSDVFLKRLLTNSELKNENETIENVQETEIIHTL